MFNLGKKSCDISSTVSSSGSGIGHFTYGNYDVLYVSLDNQYNINPAVNRVVSVIADAIANLPPIIIDKFKRSAAQFIDHPFYQTIERPNEEQVWREYVRDCISDFLLEGTTYTSLGRTSQNEVSYIRRIRPRDVQIQINTQNGNPDIYRVNGYSSQRNIKYYPYFDRKSELLKISQYNSKSMFFGDLPKSKLKSAYDEMQHLEMASKYNLSFLQKGARPSFALVVDSQNGYSGQLTEEQRDALKNEIRSRYSGVTNAGDIMVLEGGIDVKQLSTNIKDMDFHNLMELSIIIICMVAGVPPEMCGITKAKTYNSAEEARVSFFNNTIIPLANLYYEKLNSWIMYRYSPSIYTNGGKWKNAVLTYNKGSIDALEKRRLEVAKLFKETGATTINDRRKLQNLDPVDFGDNVLIGVGEMPHTLVTENATTWLNLTGEPNTSSQNQQETDEGVNEE